MGSVEDKLRAMIESRYKSVSAFAREIGMSPQTVHSALRNGITGASVNTAMPIVAKLGVDPEWLVKNQVVAADPQADFVDVPLYGSIAAGTPIEMVEVDETRPIPIAVHDRYPRAFLLRVVGESMNRILPNGCYALVDPCGEVSAPGQPYAVCVNGFDATVKRVRVLANGFELVPDSNDPTYRPKVYDYGDPDTETVTVIGRVVWYCVPFDWSF